QWAIYVINSLLRLKNCALYNYGNRAIITVGGGEGNNVNIGIELPNGGQDLHLYTNRYIGKDLNIGGKNGGIIISSFSSIAYINIENNNNILKAHKMFYLNGEIIKKEVVLGSGDPYKRSNGADSIMEISCDSNVVDAPAPDEWKYLIFEHEFEMDTALRNYRYYVQCKAMSIISAGELYLECEYIDQYVDDNTYYNLKVRSDETVSERSGVDDWTQYIEIIGIQPAVASKVRIKCYLSKYDADGRIFIDPKVVIT
ncbi:hypothetical protein LCGC14_2360730, partial [marine sediment metagenome]